MCPVRYLVLTGFHHTLGHLRWTKNAWNETKSCCEWFFSCPCWNLHWLGPSVCLNTSTHICSIFLYRNNSDHKYSTQTLFFYCSRLWMSKGSCVFVPIYKYAYEYECTNDFFWLNTLWPHDSSQVQGRWVDDFATGMETTFSMLFLSLKSILVKLWTQMWYLRSNHNDYFVLGAFQVWTKIHCHLVFWSE